MPIDHTSIVVPSSKLEPFVAFLLSSLKDLGFKEFMRPTPTAVGMGETRPYFWVIGLSPEGGDEKGHEGLLKAHHIAFVAESKSSILDYAVFGPFLQPPPSTLWNPIFIAPDQFSDLSIQILSKSINFTQQL